MATQRKMTYNISFNVDKSGLNELQTTLQQVYLNMNNSNGSQKLNSELKIAGQTARDLEKILQSAYNPKLGTINVSKFNQELKKTGYSLASLKQNLSYNKDYGSAAFNKLSQSIMNTNAQVVQSNKLLDKMGETLGNTIRWSITSSLINTITGSIQKAYTYTKQLDTSLNNIRIVTGKSAEEMDSFADSANRAAKALGASTLDYTKASLIYYQQGLSDQEVQARAETTVKVANITGQTGDAVSEQLTAVWNGYKVSAKQTEEYIDKLAAVAATTASDLEELSTGMSKVASAAKAMGVDFDDLNAQIATIVSVTRQAPESVGTALKTIYARMGDLKVDGVDEFGIKLGEVTSQMKTMGIEILDQNGNMRNMSSVMEEVAEKWNTWTRAQQQAAAIAMAGKRQYNNLVALFENWDMYSEALETSQNALGTLQKQQDIYMESTAAKLNELKANWEGLYKELFNQEDVRTAIKYLIEVVDLSSKMIKNFGGGIKTVTAFGAILTTVFSQQIGNFLNNIIQQQATIRNNLELTMTQMAAAKVGALDDDSSSKKHAQAEGYKLQLKYANEIFENRNGLTKESAAEAMNLQKNIGLLKEQSEIADADYQKAVEKNKEILEENIILEDRNMTVKEAIELGYKEEQITDARIEKALEGHKDLLDVEKERDKIQEESNELQEKLNEINDKQEQKLKEINSLEQQNTQNKKDQEKAAANLLKIEDEIEKVKNKTYYSGKVQTGITDIKSATSLSDRKNAMTSAIEATLNNSGNILKGVSSNETKDRLNTLFGELKNFDVGRGGNDRANNLLKILQEIYDLSIKDLKVVEEKEEKEKERIEDLKKQGQEIDENLKKANESYTAGTKNKDNINIQQQYDETQKKLDAIEGELTLQDEVNDKKREEAGIIKDLTALENERKEKAQELKDLEFQMKQLMENAEKGKGIIDTITGISSAFGSIAMSMNSINTLIDVWQDKEKSYGDKMLQTFMTLGFTLPTLITSFKKLEDVLGITSQKEIKSITAKVASARAEAAETAAAELRKKAEEAKNKVIQRGSELDAESAEMTELKTQAENAQTEAVKAQTKAEKERKKANEAATEASKINPYSVALVAALALIAAIGIIIKQQEKNRESLIESNKARLDEIKALQEETKENENLYNSYNELYQQYKQNKIEKEDLYDTTEKICDVYNLEGAAIAKLTGNYDELTKAVENARLEQLKAAKEQAIESTKLASDNVSLASQKTYGFADFIANKFYKFNETTSSGHYFGGGIRENIVGANAESTAYIKMLQDQNYSTIGASHVNEGNLLSNLTQNRLGGLTAVTVDLGDSIEDHLKAYEELADSIEKAEKQFTAKELVNITSFQNQKKLFNDLKLEIDAYKESTQSAYEATVLFQGANVEEIGKSSTYAEFSTAINEDLIEAIKNIDNLYGRTEEEALKYYLESLNTHYAQMYLAEQELIEQVNKDEREAFKKYLDTLSEDEKEYLFSGKVKTEFIFSVDDLEKELQASYKNLGTFEVEASVSLATTLAKGNKLKKADNQALQELEKEDAEAMAGFDDKSVLHQLDVIDEITQHKIDKNYEYLQHYTEFLEEEKNLREKQKAEIFASEEEYKQQQIELNWLQYQIETKQTRGGKQLNAEEIEALEEQAKILQDQINKYEYIKDQLADIDNKLEEGVTFDVLHDLGFNSFIADLDMIINKAESVKTAAELIGEGFTVAASDVEKFADTFPELLENYELMADGSIKLNQETLQKNLELLKEEINERSKVKLREVKEQIQLKTIEKESVDARLKALQEYLNGTSDQQETINKILKAGQDYKTKLNEINGEQVERLTNYSIDSAEKEGASVLDVLKQVEKGYEEVSKAHYAAIEGIPYDSNFNFNFNGSARTAENYAKNVGTSDAWNRYLEDMESYKETYDMALELQRQSNIYQSELDELNKKAIVLEANRNSSLNALDRAASGLAGKKNTSGKSKEEKEKEIDEEFDRYWEYKKAIDMLDKSLSRLEKTQSKLHGKELIKSLKEENKLLEKQKANYEALLQAQERQAGELQGQLASYGAIFSENGELANYADLTSNMLSQYMSAVQAYNNQAMAEAEYKIYEQQYEDFKKALSKYDSLYYSEMQDTLDKLDDARRKQLENNLKAWEVDIQIRLDTTKAERDWNDFIRDIEQDFRKIYSDLLLESVFDKKNFDSYNKDLNTTLQAIHDVENEINKLASTGASDMFESMSEAQEKLKELGSQLLENGKSLYELYENIWNNYINKLDQAADNLKDINDEFSYITDELNYQKDLIELIYGDKAYDKMNKFYTAQQKNLLTQMDSMKQQKEFWKAQFNAAYMMNKDNHNVILDDISTWTEDMRKAYDEMINSQKNLNDLIKEGIENLKDKYLNKLADTFEEMETALFGDNLDVVREDWEKRNDVKEEYLDQYGNALGKIQSLTNKINKDINNTSNLKMQQKMQDFMNQNVKSMRDKEYLSEKEYELVEARYNLMLKEMALEDAKNAKTTMKLTRNTSGNWTYQYVADEDEVADKQQELTQGYLDLYDLANDAYKHGVERLFSLSEAMKKEINNVYESGLSEEEKLAKVADIQAWYEPLMQAAREDIEGYREEITSAYAMMLADSYGLDKDMYESLTEDKKALVDSFKDKTIDDYESMRSAIVDKTFPEISDAATTAVTNSNQMLQSLAAETIATYDTDDDSVKNILDNAFNTIIDDVVSFEDELNTMKDVSGEDFSLVEQNIDEVSEKIDKMGIKTELMVDKSSTVLDQMREAVERVALQFDEVIQRIQDATKEIAYYKDATAKAADALKNLNIQMQKYNALAGNGRGTGNTGSGFDSDDKDKNTLTNQKYKWQADPYGNESTMGLIDSKGNYVKITDDIYMDLEQMVQASKKGNVSLENMLNVKKNDIAKKFGVDVNQIDFSELDKLISIYDTTVYHDRDLYSGSEVWGLPSNVGQDSANSFYDYDGVDYNQNLILLLLSGDWDDPLVQEWLNNPEGFKKKYNAAHMATGGYTGDWATDNGKLAVLHQKELVLNADDTSNFLKATSLLRDISKLNGNVESSIMTSILTMMDTLSPKVFGINAETQTEESSGNVFNITAEFPNANDVDTIREAILTLPNLASQYIH